MTPEDRLDAALDSDLAAYAASPDVRRMIDTSTEISVALAGRRLDGETRERIYATAIANAGTHRIRGRLRTLRLDRRMQTLAGGAVVTLAAAAAVGVAVVRGRRHASASI